MTYASGAFTDPRPRMYIYIYIYIYIFVYLLLLLLLLLLLFCVEHLWRAVTPVLIEYLGSRSALGHLGKVIYK